MAEPVDGSQEGQQMTEPPLPIVTRFQQVLAVGRFSIIYLSPLVLSLVFLAGNEPWVRVIYVSLIMATYWASEALPLAVTSLIPVAAFPLLGIETTTVVVGKYMSDVVMMFLGGLIVALAVEKANLHKRLALTIIRLVGPGKFRVMTSVMAVTALLSVFISNTAATAMMIPIVKGILKSIEKKNEDSDEPKGMYGTILLLSVAYSANIGGVALVTGTPPNLIAFRILEGSVTFADWIFFASPLMVANLLACLIYLQLVITLFNRRDGIQSGSSIFRPFLWLYHKLSTKKEPGSGTEISALNVSHQDQLPLAESPSKRPNKNQGSNGEANEVFNVNEVDHRADIEFIDQEPDHPIGNDQHDGRQVAPGAEGDLGVQGDHGDQNNQEDQSDQGANAEGELDEPPQVEDIRAFVNRNLKEMGPISYRECVMSLLFIILVCLWFFQRPRFLVGWADLVEGESGPEIGAATPAILTVLLLFVIPATNPVSMLTRGKHPNFLLDWNSVQTNIPWGIVLLLGGGLALSHGIKVSGLAKLIVDHTKAVSEDITPSALNVLVCFFTSMVTEVVSNTATSNIVLPMLMEVSKALCVNPIYFVMSAVITCSNAFMLPVATAPNALVFSAMPPGKLSTGNMIGIGFFLNIISIANTLFWISTLGNTYFQLYYFPEEFSNNRTICTHNLRNITST